MWHVVFGAGPLGLAVARALVARGHKTRLVSRSGRAQAPPGAEAVAADVTDLESARRACNGAAVIYHCANAPYAEWVTALPPIARGVLDVAEAAGARLVYGDNLYMYGPVSGPLTEDLPYRAAGPNGRTRAQIATAIMAAHAQGRIQAAIGRASDFFGPHVLTSTMGDRVFPAIVAGRPAQVLGDPDAPHTYTFIDDFGRGLVTLGEHDEALGEIWHVPSAETLTTRQFVTIVAGQAGRSPRLTAAPRWGIALFAAFSPMMRAVKEQLYQAEQPFVADHSKFARAFGASPTPHPEAIRQTLVWFRERARPAR